MRSDTSPVQDLAQFSSGREPGNFFSNWLRLQCEFIEGACAALLVLREGDTATYRSVAAWPLSRTNMTPLAEAAQYSLSRRENVFVEDENAAGPGRRGILVAHSVAAADGGLPLGAVTVAIEGGLTSEAREAVIRQLHWGAGWIEATEWRRRAMQAPPQPVQVTQALEVVAICGENLELAASALAVANMLSERLQCGRVSLGMMSGHAIKLRALSHAATFDRRSTLARMLENAMEEAFHQNRTIAEPPSSPDDRAISIAHRELVRKAGLPVVLSCVLPGRTRPIGVMTLERAGSPFSPADIDLVDAIAALLGPILELQAEREHWIAGRGAKLAREWLDKLRSPDRPSLRLGVAAAVLVPLLLMLIPGTFHVSGRSVLEGQVQRVLVAPFDGFVREAPARAGDLVHTGALLARLDDRDQQLERVRWLSERQTLMAKYANAMATHDRPNVMILAAQLRQAQAQLDLAEDKLGRTRIVAPFDSVVVSGDLSQALGSPVERGKTLFEVAPLDSFRVIVQVDERDIRYVRIGQHGRLVLAGMPADAIPFTVTKTTPIATAEDGRNYFRVEAAMDKRDARLRPGMEGVARIAAGSRPLIWIWTRSLIEWMRISLWKWLP